MLNKLLRANLIFKIVWQLFQSSCPHLQKKSLLFYVWGDQSPLRGPEQVSWLYPATEPTVPAKSRQSHGWQQGEGAGDPMVGSLGKQCSFAGTLRVEVVLTGMTRAFFPQGPGTSSLTFPDLPWISLTERAPLVFSTNCCYYFTVLSIYQSFCSW